MLRHHLALLRELLGGKLPRITLRRLPGFAQIDLDELRAKRVHLLFDRRTRVERFDARAEPLCGRDRLQAGDPDADDENAQLA